MHTLDNKVRKMLYDLNDVLKHSFNRYYLKYSGEASASLEDHSGDKKYRLTYAKTKKPVYQIFDFFQVPEGYVIYFDAYAIFKALKMATKINGFFIIDGMIFINTCSPEVAKIKDCPWETDGTNFNVPIGQIREPRYCTKIFNIATVDIVQDELVNVTGYIKQILGKNMVKLTDNGMSITVGKPVIPGLTDKCKLFLKCNRMDEASIMVHLCMEKEQVFKCHSIVAYG